MGLKIQLMDIIKRATSFDKKMGIIKNGAENLYSEKIERYINNSVTAKSASNIMASYITGQGFVNSNSFLVNEKTTLFEFSTKFSKSIAKQRGAFIHVNYNLHHEITSFDLLPYTHCRLGKKDSNKYNGKIVVYDNWNKENGKIVPKDFNIVDVFNADKKVIENQIKNAGGIKKYKGQILFVNLDSEYNYPLSSIDSVQYDCDSESQSSLFKNKSLRKGFFGKTVVVTKPLIGSREHYDNDIDYASAQSERTAFKDTIDQFIGAENTGGVLHVEMEHDGDNLSDAIKFENIGSDINDKLFEYTELSTFKNILMAFNNIPIGLVRSDNALFGNSGESLKEMQRVYRISTTQERMILEQTIQMLMRNHKKKIEVELIKEIENGIN